MQVNTARFWIYWNGGWVKMSVRRGQELQIATASLTDEGHSYESERYEFPADEDVVYCEMASGGSDCHGPIYHYSNCMCSLSDLKAVPAESDEYGDQPDRPEWTRISAHQRDVFAEMAGY